MSRTIHRRIARSLYDRFSRDWRREKRMAGMHGRPGRRPTFNQWYRMHQADSGMMAQATVSDVREYLGDDPWAEPAAPAHAPTERGVVTIPMTGGTEEPS
jgi:hypothetical protein